MNIELAVILSFTSLLVLMLRYKVHAFLSILIACLILGILGLEDPMSTFDSIQKGLGGTLLRWGNCRFRIVFRSCSAAHGRY